MLPRKFFELSQTQTDYNYTSSYSTEIENLSVAPMACVLVHNAADVNKIVMIFFVLIVMLILTCFKLLNSSSQLNS